MKSMENNFEMKWEKNESVKKRICIYWWIASVIWGDQPESSTWLMIHFIFMKRIIREILSWKLFASYLMGIIWEIKETVLQNFFSFWNFFFKLFLFKTFWRYFITKFNSRHQLYFHYIKNFNRLCARIIKIDKILSNIIFL